MSGSSPIRYVRKRATAEARPDLEAARARLALIAAKSCRTCGGKRRPIGAPPCEPPCEPPCDAPPACEASRPS
eukprot:2125678-Prymnesium_polylepis.2